jgi:hypothetical protein
VGAKHLHIPKFTLFSPIPGGWEDYNKKRIQFFSHYRKEFAVKAIAAYPFSRRML